MKITLPPDSEPCDEFLSIIAKHKKENKNLTHLARMQRLSAHYVLFINRTFLETQK